MAEETTLSEVGEMLVHVVEHMATKEEVTDVKTEMMEQFEHAEKQFRALDARLRDIASEIAVIHRRVERLEELGASHAGFAKEIDHTLFFFRLQPTWAGFVVRFSPCLMLSCVIESKGTCEPQRIQWSFNERLQRTWF
jgi:hypothetical protein